MIHGLAVQWNGRKGIRVNARAPGFCPLEMTDQFADGYLDSQLPCIPAGRTGDPGELAAAVVFLAGPAARYLTGTTLVVDEVSRRSGDVLNCNWFPLR